MKLFPFSQNITDVKGSEIAAEHARDEETKNYSLSAVYGACMAMHMFAISTYVKADERILFSEKA